MITRGFKLTMFTCRCCCLNFRPLTCYTSMIQELTHRDSASLKALFPWYISEHLSLLEPISEIVFYQSEKKPRKVNPTSPEPVEISIQVDSTTASVSEPSILLAGYSGAVFSPQTDLSITRSNFSCHFIWFTCGVTSLLVYSYPSGFNTGMI